MTGTSGVLRWTVGSQTDLVLSVMWSIPYNRQLWKTWVGVGLTNSSDVVSFDQMYSDRDDARFVRKRAGTGEFEFSDAGGKFIVIARMGDAGRTFKPVLHLGLMPVDEQDLASGVRRQLGVTVEKPDDVSVIKEPFELVQANGAQMHSAAAPMMMMMIALLSISCASALG